MTTEELFKWLEISKPWQETTKEEVIRMLASRVKLLEERFK